MSAEHLHSAGTNSRTTLGGFRWLLRKWERTVFVYGSPSARNATMLHAKEVIPFLLFDRGKSSTLA